MQRQRVQIAEQSVRTRPDGSRSIRALVFNNLAVPACEVALRSESWSVPVSGTLPPGGLRLASFDVPPAVDLRKVSLTSRSADCPAAIAEGAIRSDRRLVLGCTGSVPSLKAEENTTALGGAVEKPSSATLGQEVASSAGRVAAGNKTVAGREPAALVVALKAAADYGVAAPVEVLAMEVVPGPWDWRVTVTVRNPAEVQTGQVRLVVAPVRKLDRQGVHLDRRPEDGAGRHTDVRRDPSAPAVRSAGGPAPRRRSRFELTWRSGQEDGRARGLPSLERRVRGRRLAEREGRVDLHLHRARTDHGEEVGGRREEVLPPCGVGHQRRARQEEGALLGEEERGDRSNGARSVAVGDQETERRQAVEGALERVLPDGVVDDPDSGAAGDLLHPGDEALPRRDDDVVTPRLAREGRLGVGGDGADHGRAEASGPMGGDEADAAGRRVEEDRLPRPRRGASAAGGTARSFP